MQPASATKEIPNSLWCERQIFPPAINIESHFAARVEASIRMIGHPDRALPGRRCGIDRCGIFLATRRGSAGAWIVDGAGLPKKSGHSAVPARRCRGQFGKQDNNRVSATLSITNRSAGRGPPAFVHAYLSATLPPTGETHGGVPGKRSAARRNSPLRFENPRQCLPLRSPDNRSDLTKCYVRNIRFSWNPNCLFWTHRHS